LVASVKNEDGDLALILAAEEQIKQKKSTLTVGVFQQP
jgi:hypothetical protein